MSAVSEEVATQIPQNCRRRQPHSHLRPPPRGTPASILIYLIFPKTRVIGLHFCRCMYGSTFIQFCAVASKRCIFSAPECVLAAQGRSGSSKVDDFDTSASVSLDFMALYKFYSYLILSYTNRKCVCDFLLVGHCNYGSILHRFWDTAIYWLKIADFSYPSLIRRPHSLCSL